jgi:rhodanese-related sulfurtransferase
VALMLERRGITRVRPLAGGLDGWRRLGYPLVAAERGGVAVAGA